CMQTLEFPPWTF
nr:immunoglobulin light chain junction region [Macaca mulatta]